MTLNNFPVPLYIVGGWVRDKYLGLEPKDVDLASEMLPHQVIQWADSQGIPAKVTNERHLVVTFTLDSVHYEHTTFRLETDCDGINANCAPTRSLKEDLERRDFTINALAYPFSEREEFNPSKIIGVEGWKEDIDNRVLRLVASTRYGSAMERLTQSGNRFFRAFRFLVKFNMVFDELSRQAMQQFAPEAFRYSNAESFREEWEKCGYDLFYLSFLHLYGFLDYEPDVLNHVSKRYPWFAALESSSLEPKEFFEVFKVPKKAKAEIGEIDKAFSMAEASPVEWHMWNPRHIDKSKLMGMAGAKAFLKEGLFSLSDFFKQYGSSHSVEQVKAFWKEYLEEEYGV